jgi:hypothetical protein
MRRPVNLTIKTSIEAFSVPSERAESATAPTMKPMLLLALDPPADDVAAGLDSGMRVVAAAAERATLAPLLARFERAYRSHELIPVDPETLARLGLEDVLNAQRRPGPRDYVIRGAISYAGVPDAALLYEASDLGYLAAAVRPTHRRPRCLGVPRARLSQTDTLLELGYRTVLVHASGAGGLDLLATEEDLAHAASAGEEQGRWAIWRALIAACMDRTGDQAARS